MLTLRGSVGGIIYHDSIRLHLGGHIHNNPIEKLSLKLGKPARKLWLFVAAPVQIGSRRERSELHLHEVHVHALGEWVLRALDTYVPDLVAVSLSF